MIIGLSGTLSSGKDTVAQYLIEKGYEHISLSDLIREEAKKRGMGVDRDSLRELGNILVGEKGEDALAKIAMERKKTDKLIISSVRKPKEVDYLRSLPHFVMLFVDAPIEVRYQRMVSRARAGDKTMTLQELKEKEDMEMSGKSTQRLDYCKEHADYFINNISNLDDLYSQVNKILKEINA